MKLIATYLFSLISLLSIGQTWQVGNVNAFNGEFTYATIEGSYTAADINKNMISSYERNPEFGIRTDKTKEHDIELLLILYGISEEYLYDMLIEFRFPFDNFILKFDLFHNKAASTPMFVIKQQYGDILSQGTLIQRLKRFNQVFIRVFNDQNKKEIFATFSLNGSSSAIDQVLKYY